MYLDRLVLVLSLVSIALSCSSDDECFTGDYNTAYGCDYQVGCWSYGKSWYLVPGGYFKSSLTATSWGNGRIDRIGTGGDGILWWNTATAGSNPGSWSWSDYHSLGFPAVTEASLVNWGPGRLDLFWRYESHLQHSASDGNYFSSPEQLGSPTGAGFCAPSAISTNPGEIDIFVTAQDSRDVWRKAWRGYWTEWQNLGGYVSSAPAAVSWGGGRIDVFACAYDNTMWQITSLDNGKNWGGWSYLDICVGYGNPSAVGPGEGLLTIVQADNDGAVWEKHYNKGAGWSSWQKLNNQVSSRFDPIVIHEPNGGLHVYIWGTDNQGYGYDFWPSSTSVWNIESEFNLKKSREENIISNLNYTTIVIISVSSIVGVILIAVVAIVIRQWKKKNQLPEDLTVSLT